MKTRLRFGKKMSLPSTIELKNELRLMAAAEALAGTSADADVDTIIRDLACKHGLSKDRAQMLVDRFGHDRYALEGAAQDLCASKAVTRPVEGTPTFFG